MTGLRSIRVGLRLAAGFASVTIAFVGLILATGILAKADWQRLDSLHLELRHKIDAINSIQAKQLLLVSTIRNASLHQESAMVNADIEIYKKLVSEIQVSEGELLASNPNKIQIRILDEIVKVRTEAESVAKQAADFTLSYSGDLAAKLLTSEFAEQDVKWRKLLDDLRSSYLEAAQQQIKESREVSGQHTLWSLISVGVICAFAWFFSRWLTKSVVKPLEQTVAFATSFASGDLTAKIQVEGRDELSKLQAALGEMGLRLSSLVEKVRTSSNEVQDVSQQVADQSGALSVRTAEQAASLEQTAAAMEQITSTVQENAASTNTATFQAKEALHSVSNGERVIGEVIQAISEIAEGSTRMSDVTGVVNSLAFQINILSLNAAVEAARAGEHGRGFAVVASEVRSLAQRSAAAAKEIGTLISQSTERVAMGQRKAAATVDAMRDITERVSSVQTLLENVSFALTEQSKGVTEVGVAVTRLDQMTQENAALVDRGASVANHLVYQSELLSRSVAEFQTSTA